MWLLTRTTQARIRFNNEYLLFNEELPNRPIRKSIYSKYVFVVIWGPC